MEDISHTLEEDEDAASSADDGGCSDTETKPEGEDKDEEEEEEHSSTSQDFLSEEPQTKWVSSAVLAAALEPWNSRLWIGLENPGLRWSCPEAFPWESLRVTKERMRCSLIYASVFLRSCRRKIIRSVSLGITARCPKRSQNPNDGSMHEL
jgi:hypothetical protein